jgi:hypothetical protein
MSASEGDGSLFCIKHMWSRRDMFLVRTCPDSWIMTLPLLSASSGSAKVINSVLIKLCHVYRYYCITSIPYACASSGPRDIKFKTTNITKNSTIDLPHFTAAEVQDRTSGQRHATALM